MSRNMNTEPQLGEDVFTSPLFTPLDLVFDLDGGRLLPRFRSRTYDRDDVLREAIGFAVAGMNPLLILIPKQFLRPGDLPVPRVTAIRERLRSSGGSEPLEVPFPRLMATVRGERQRKMRRVDKEPAAWVDLAYRRALQGSKVEDLLAPLSVPGEIRGKNDNRHLREYLRRMERALGDAGVLPWSVYDNAIVPPSWQQSPEIAAACDRWQAQSRELGEIAGLLEQMSPHSPLGRSLAEAGRDALAGYRVAEAAYRRTGDLEETVRALDAVYPDRRAA